MEDKILSTLCFKSNLQPIRAEHLINDSSFLSFVRDPFGLEKLYNLYGYNLTPIQEKEYRSAAVHCAYAYKDDYPWGTIVDEDGNEHVVCKCTNTACRRFDECRPDFDKEELRCEEENLILSERISKTIGNFNDEEAVHLTLDEGESSKHGDKEAASSLYDKFVIVNETDEEVESDESEANELEQENGELTIQKDATFESFISVEQTKIIELCYQDRTVVNAGPGTGKTWTLIEKIKYMLVEQEVEPENIVVLCFSRAAVEVIRNRLESAADIGALPLNWHLVDVRTFDSFATYMLAWLQENVPECLPVGYTLENQNYEQRIKTATNILKKEKDMLIEYQHVIIDEVQDLVGARAEMVLALLEGLPITCGFTLLGDSCQSLYDYLAHKDLSVMSSNEFYKRVFHEFKTANMFSLEHNYRQGDEFGEFTIPYRKAILSGDSSSRRREASLLTDTVQTAELKLQKLSNKEIAQYKKDGTLGILTRTNGQALQISSWMRTQGVKHQLQKPNNSMDLAEWISRILMMAETDVIDFEEFEIIFAREYPEQEENAMRFWEALLSTQKKQTSNHYEIEDLLKGLLHNAKHPLLYEEPRKDSIEITVSNIHRAKGREFDTVLVIEDVIANMAEAEVDDELEHKVCYVALTRPKKRIQKVSLKPQYIYISKDEYRKCFRSGGFAKKKYLSHYEIGDSIDLNPRTFARSPEIQEYIRSRLSADTRLKLLKCPQGTNNYVTYKIVLEDDENTVLGFTSWDFAIGMERAIQRIYANYHSIDYKYFPNIFGDIYFDGLTTCVSAMEKGIEGAKQFGGMYMWKGISISGFAQMEKDRY